ncbi:uncharacterized protein wtrw [Prorops nasuta]|uniref:uncharacterized protein wtrw n=1 Tax=Prorops nasuta TaxID=863751 RepID=UPI0034CEF1E4
MSRQSASTFSNTRKKTPLEKSFNMHSFSSPDTPRGKTTTSLLLTRWLASRNRQSPEPESLVTPSEDRSMDFGTPPPIEEPHCYSLCISESSYADESSCALQVNKDIVKNLLIEHMRFVGGRVHLFEDLDTPKWTDESLKRFLDTCKPQEINVLLLHASFLGRSDLIASLHKAGADLNHSEQEQGLTALHLCAFSNCLSGVRYLINNGATINGKRNYTPFHYAAFGNSLNVAQYFLQQGITQEAAGSPFAEETVLHSAARSNALDVLRILVNGSLHLNRLDCNGLGPIHHVADRGDPACLAALLQAGCQVDLLSKKGETALHLAAEAGCADNVDLLLDRGASVNLKNHRGQTALHMAARAHSLECVEILLRKGGCDPNVEDNDGRAPLHLALGRSLLAYDVTEFLITWKANVNKVDKYGYTPLHVAALNELSQCVDVLIQHGADLTATTKGGTSALSIILRKTPTSLNIFKQRLDASITLQQHGSAAGEVELRLDFHPLLQHQQQGEIGYLGTFVKEGYKEILEHPLCQSFLHLKWQKIRKYYVGRLVFYLVFVLVLTAWVITALAHNCYNESHGQVDNPRMPLCANTTGLNGFLYRHPVVLEIEWYALVVLTVLEALRKLTGILTYLSVRQFFTQAENMVEWCVIFSVFATSFVYTGRTYTWQSHVGAFAVLCGWSNLMLMIGQLPMFGAYVAMFTSVQAQVFKLLLAYACLLVGFTASFCVIFPRSKSFSSPHTGLIKVLVMMTGELDFEDLFFPGEEDGVRPVDVGGTSWILLQVSAQLSFVLFLLFVTIVLMNLLVGIAVHDIKGLQKTAGLAKLVRQTKLICDVESALFLGLLPKKLLKFLRWTALVLPSPLRAVLTVRPLNPREARLPRDVLSSAYKVARDRKSATGTVSSKRSNSTAYTILKSDYSTFRRKTDDDVFTEDNNKVKDEIAELKKLCEKNHKLIQDLVMTLAIDKRFNPEIDIDTDSAHRDRLASWEMKIKLKILGNYVRRPARRFHCQLAASKIRADRHSKLCILVSSAITGVRVGGEDYYASRTSKKETKYQDKTEEDTIERFSFYSSEEVDCTKLVQSRIDRFSWSLASSKLGLVRRRHSFVTVASKLAPNDPEKHSDSIVKFLKSKPADSEINFNEETVAKSKQIPFLKSLQNYWEINARNFLGIFKVNISRVCDPRVTKESREDARMDKCGSGWLIRRDENARCQYVARRVLRSCKISSSSVGDNWLKMHEDERNDQTELEADKKASSLELTVSNEEPVKGLEISDDAKPPVDCSNRTELIAEKELKEKMTRKIKELKSDVSDPLGSGTKEKSTRKMNSVSMQPRRPSTLFKIPEEKAAVVNQDLTPRTPTCETPGRLRHCSLTGLDERRGRKDPLSVRMAPTYRSVRCFNPKHEKNNYPDCESPVENVEIDAGQPPPADESLFFDNLEALREAQRINGASLKSAMWSIVGAPEMRLLLDMEKGFIIPEISSNPRLRNIAFIWACYRGLVHLMPILEAFGAKIEYIEPKTGVTPLLAACLAGNVACIRLLVKKGADVNSANTINHYTPLHFAAFGDSKEAAIVLLDTGAKLRNHECQEVVEPVLHCAVRTKATEVVKLLLDRGASVAEKNHLGETPLHVSCFVQSIESADILLNSPGTNINAVDRGHRTPLHFAVMSTNSSPDLVELLLKNGALVNAIDRIGFTPLHIAALNEQSRCVEALIWAGADVSATTNTGLSALNVILRKIPESLQVFRQRLDASITLRRPVPHNREFEMRFHFDLLFPCNNQCETSFINTFVQERRKDLLSHPLVMAFLHLKWEKIRKFYLMRILLYAMTVICMTTYVLTALAYKCYNTSDAASSKICSNKRISGFLFRRPVIEIEWYLSLVLTCITIPRKIFGFMVYKSAKQYFSNIDNVLDGIVIVSVFVTSFVYTGRTYDWQNYIGAFAILCAWTNLMLMVGQLPAFGTYVAMFTHIQFEFAKLLLAYSGLLIGFTISFCVIFVGEPSFGNPFTGLIKVLAMMAGELDFEGLINQADPTTDGPFVIYHPLSVCSQIIFTLFIVFVTVILMNLLVGIAVHDIQGLRNHAGLTKLVRQTKLILFTEMVLHNGSIPYTFRKWMSDHKIDVENRKRVLVVKPLNPLEKRLPKDILKAAYEIAQKNIPFASDDNVSLSEHMLMRQQSEEMNEANLQSVIEKLTVKMRTNEDVIRTLKDQLQNTNKLLEDIVEKLTKEKVTSDKLYYKQVLNQEASFLGLKYFWQYKRLHRIGPLQKLNHQLLAGLKDMYLMNLMRLLLLKEFKIISKNFLYNFNRKILSLLELAFCISLTLSLVLSKISFKNAYPSFPISLLDYKNALPENAAAISLAIYNVVPSLLRIGTGLICKSTISLLSSPFLRIFICLISYTTAFPVSSWRKIALAWSNIFESNSAFLLADMYALYKASIGLSSISFSLISAKFIPRSIKPNCVPQSPKTTYEGDKQTFQWSCHTVNEEEMQYFHSSSFFVAKYQVRFIRLENNYLVQKKIVKMFRKQSLLTLQLLENGNTGICIFAELVGCETCMSFHSIIFLSMAHVSTVRQCALLWSFLLYILVNYNKSLSFLQKLVSIGSDLQLTRTVSGLQISGLGRMPIAVSVEADFISLFSLVGLKHSFSSVSGISSFSINSV